MKQLTQLTLTDMSSKTKATNTTLTKEVAVVTPGEKTGVARRVPTSQELAKDPDPKPVAKKLDFSHPAIFNKKYSLKSFARTAKIAKKSMYIGTEALVEWSTRYPAYFEDPADRYDWIMYSEDKLTWLDAADHLFEHCKNDWDKVEKFLEEPWDPSLLDSAGDLDHEKDQSWIIRRFTHAIAHQDPTVLFHIEEEDQKGDDVPLFQSTFWDNTDWYNPVFKKDAHPLAKIWLLSSNALGHPWASMTTKAEVEFEERKNQQKMARENKKKGKKRGNSSSDGEAHRLKAPVQPSSPDKLGVRFQIAKEDEDSDGASSSAMQTDSPDAECARATVSKKKRSGKERRKNAEKMANASHSSLANAETDDDLPPLAKYGDPGFGEHLDSSSDEEISPLNENIPGTTVKETPKKNNRIKEDVIVETVLSDEENEWTEGDDSPTACQARDEATTTKEISSPPSMRRSTSKQSSSSSYSFTFKHGERSSIPRARPTVQNQMNIDSPTRRTYRDAAAAQPQAAIVPEEQRFKELTQMNINGLPLKNCALFIVAIPFMWNGSSSGKTTIGQKCVSAIHAAWTYLFQLKQGFKILPVSDDQYRNQKLWITSVEAMKRLASKWHQVKKYLDMSFGNAEWITSQGKQAGSKVLRTRMRVGFDDTHEGAMATIGNILEDDGGNCWRSPLQFGDITRIGFLPFYPAGVSRPFLEKAMVKFLEFSAPVGLGMDWVATPNVRRNAWKPGQRSQSIRLWHVFVKNSDARQVDTRLRQWLHPSTPIRDFPCAAVTQYTHDWKAVNRNRLSVNPYGPVKDLVLTMITKSIDFASITETFCSPIPIPGMFKVVKTEHFGETSLLKFMMAIKATPAQAEAASEEAKKQVAKEESSSDESSEEQDEGFIAVSKKPKKLSKNSLQQAAEKSMYAERPGAREAAERAESVRKQDRDNKTAASLFQMILPETLTEYYCLTAREKFFQLALNVANGLGPFLIYHLAETSRERETYILTKWLGKKELHRIRSRGLVWDAEKMCARVPTTGATTPTVDHGLDWLDFGQDVLDQVQGLLEIDMDMADIRDIDDGATVAGAVDELRAVENRLQNMVTVVNVAQSENAGLRSENSGLRAQVARLEALMKESLTTQQSSRAADQQDLNGRQESPPDDTQGAQASRGGGSSTARG